MAHPPPPSRQTGIGIIAPHDMVLDRELWRWVPEEVSLYFTRTPHSPREATVEMITEISTVATVTDAVNRLASTGSEVYAYACTSCSFVRGRDGEHALTEGMRAAGAPFAVTTSGALIAALSHLGARKVAAVAPYNDALTALFEKFLLEAGIELSGCTNLGLTANISDVSYDTTSDLIRRADDPDAEAICVSCTNLPTYDVIAPLEAELGKPVITANQATVWHSLRGLRPARAAGVQSLFNATS